MTIIKSHLILASLFVALIGTTMVVSATCNNTGPYKTSGTSILAGAMIASR